MGEPRSNYSDMISTAVALWFHPIKAPLLVCKLLLCGIAVGSQGPRHTSRDESNQGQGDQLELLKLLNFNLKNFDGSAEHRVLRDHGIRDELAPLPGLRTLYFGLRKDLVHRNSSGGDRNSLRWRERSPFIIFVIQRA